MSEKLNQAISNFFDNWTANEATSLLYETITAAVGSDHLSNADKSNLLIMHKHMDSLLREAEKTHATGN